MIRTRFIDADILKKGAKNRAAWNPDGPSQTEMRQLEDETTAKLPQRKAKKSPRIAQDGAGSDGEQALGNQLRAAGISGWEREYRFLPPRRWRLDFAWPDRLIAVEVEGGIFSGGRHVRGVGFEADCEKYNESALAGWRLIRVTPGMVKDGQALAWIRRALA